MLCATDRKFGNLRAHLGTWFNIPPLGKGHGMKEVALGIDLGTTNSVAAIAESGVTSVVPSKYGDSYTPSVVAIKKDSKFVVGKNASRQQLINPENTYCLVKRLIGTRPQNETAEQKN